MPGERTDSLFVLVLALAVLGAGCSVPSSEEQHQKAAPSPTSRETAGDSSGAERAPTTSRCEVTEPVAPPELPAVLREEGGDWYGKGSLWAQIPGDLPAARQADGSYNLKHAWVILDSRGRSTSRHGPPQFETVRLDAPGRARGSSGGFATAAGFSWWPTVFNYPTAGCWAEIGIVGETRVRLVVQVY